MTATALTVTTGYSPVFSMMEKLVFQQYCFYLVYSFFHNLKTDIKIEAT